MGSCPDTDIDPSNQQQKETWLSIMQSCNTTCSKSQVKKPFSIDYQRYYFFPHGPNNVREEGDGQTHNVE